MIHAITTFLLLALAVWAGPRPAMAEVARLQGILVEEVELERTLISKPGWLRGLHFISQAASPLAGPHIRVVLPGAWAGDKMCARITTMAGSYTAVVEYQIPADLPHNQDYVLDFDAQSAVARDATPANSGVSLERGPCVQTASGGQEARAFIASYWNQDSRPQLTDTGDVQLLLHLNIARADELVFEATIGGTPLPSKCDRLNDPNALAYNFGCVIDVSPSFFVADGHQTIDVRYTRIHRARESDPRGARILIGAGQ